jgi:hypothetical protein
MYQRYSNPLEIMDVMIDSGRLFEFICEMFAIRREEIEEKQMWEYWLHKVWEGSYAQFRESALNDENNNAAPTHEDLSRIASESANMLMNFCPDGGGEQHGTVQAVGDNSG